MKRMNKVALSVLAVCIGFSGFTIASSDKSNKKDSYENSSYKSDEKSKGKHKGNKHKYKDYYDYYGYKSYKPYHEDTKQRLALNLVGKNYMYEKYVPDIDGDGYPDLASCFDVELKNIADGELVGTATDCLSDITPAGNGDGVKLIGTTFFNLPGGQIVTRGLTTVQPVLQPTVTPDGEYITHITGASSDKNSVLKATGDYEWLRGTVRLSGMVNLEKFSNTVGDPIFFDCLFIIDLKKVNRDHPYWNKWYKHYFYQDYYAAHYGDDTDDSGDDSYEDPYDDSGDDSYKDPYDDSDDDSYEDPYDDSKDTYSSSGY
ncbi:hypothetical protein MD588_13035 [Photobacterium sp. SDRW27]|uniref:hypothetical protein n=1 Tax=Photobacterium obscurum TaxID=2829490 RepID=UPI0022440805|nr:hypothetical protein [Photobacterium obscurum]MCW8329735.1 hypothetical protein [Photobacterium obscurum]